MKSYGTVKLEKGRWVIDCEPHVAIRLRRLFVGAKGRKRITLPDTEQSCEDLRWFLERYPMEVEDRDRLERRAATFVEGVSLVDDLLAGRRQPEAFELALPPREYQRLAANIALARGGLLLADDVGLGKTVTSICTMADPRTLPCLVVTLTHLPRQWEAEINRFAPHLKTHILKKATPYDLRRSKHVSGQIDLIKPQLPDVIICNYHKLAGWAETLAPIIRSVVWDECQELRRTQSKKWEAAHYLAESSSFRLGLSATPIYNYGGEFWAVLECIRPGELGEEWEFVSEWCTRAFDKPKIRDAKAFGAYLRDASLMLRRTRADVGRELPPVTKIPHTINTDSKALTKVGGDAVELARIILAQTEQQRGAKMMASEELSVLLRQATGVAKAPYVAEFVRLLVESGERVLLYGWHRDVYAIWREKLADLQPALFTGSESPLQKERSRQAFLEGDTNILVMSLRAGAGLDGLQAVCRTVVFGELDWSPGVMEQCIGRIARDGQSDPVAAYYLLAEDGSDPIVADVLGLKKQQIEGVVDPDAALVQRLETGEGNMKRLAQEFLRQRGLAQKEVA